MSKVQWQSEIPRKKSECTQEVCTRVHKMDNGMSVNRLLYTGLRMLLDFVLVKAQIWPTKHLWATVSKCSKLLNIAVFLKNSFGTRPVINPLYWKNCMTKISSISTYRCILHMDFISYLFTVSLIHFVTYITLPYITCKVYMYILYVTCNCSICLTVGYIFLKKTFCYFYR